MSFNKKFFFLSLGFFFFLLVVLSLLLWVYFQKTRDLPFGLGDIFLTGNKDVDFGSFFSPEDLIEGHVIEVDLIDESISLSVTGQEELVLVPVDEETKIYLIRPPAQAGVPNRKLINLDEVKIGDWISWDSDFGIIRISHGAE